MAHVSVHGDRELDLDEPSLIEGLPGAGLVGKIATDYLVESFGMDHVGDIHCDGIPNVAVYRDDEPEAVPPVRLYADEGRDLLALVSDVPVSPSEAPEFATCLTGWLETNDVFPIYLSGMPDRNEGPRDVHGVATGGATDRLAEAGVTPPDESGVISGPTGALFARAGEVDLPAVCLVVETAGQFPDPDAARSAIDGAIGSLTGTDADTGTLVERAEDVRAARERLAEQLRQADDESSEAMPIRGFQ